MAKPKLLLYLIAFLLFGSCKSDQNYHYSIKDFSKPLQPHLRDIVSLGMVGFDTSLATMATDKELIQLSHSEHPLLRASAFREILNRKSFDHFDILMNHLDDTATVFIDQGEFGIGFRTISDYILQHGRWRTDEAKNKTIDIVLTKHNYLESAYRILLKIEPQERLYSFIKDMATRPRRLADDGYDLDFDDIEYALYGLAKYKKPGDIEIIANQLMKNVWRLSHISFRLMKEYPDTAYLNIFQAYYRRTFYTWSGYRRGGFTGGRYDRAEPEDFINALIEQEDVRSAKLLDTILNHLPKVNCMPKREDIENATLLAIWKNPSPVYAQLRKKIETKTKALIKPPIFLELDKSTMLVDTAEKYIGWY